MKKWQLLALSVCTMSSWLTAQSISLSFQQESVSLPFTRFEQWNPGAEIEYGFAPREKGTGLRQVNISVGYYFHRELASAFYAKVEYDFAFRIAEDTYLDLVPAAGYMHSFYPGEVYESDGAGNYNLKRQLGRPHLWIESGFGVSFFRSKKISPFMQYRLAVETPFGNGIPVFPHSFYQLGLQYKL
ncbi:MAG: hypothetical protein AAGI23_06205 [Bacteroidota bacterium]